MAKSPALVKIGKIQQRIPLIRGEKAIFDSDLADAYGVTTKALNQAIRRNAERVPPGFMFRLTNSAIVRYSYSVSQRFLYTLMPCKTVEWSLLKYLPIL